MYLFQLLGSRIEEMMLAAEQNASTSVPDEARQRQLLAEDEDEDFMDEGRKMFKIMESTH